LPKLFFPEGMGVYIMLVEISGGVRGYFCVQKLEIPGRRGVELT